MGTVEGLHRRRVIKEMGQDPGYTPIPNAILDMLIQCRIPGQEMQCLLYILRKTDGFHKSTDWISNSQFVAATGMKKQNVSRAIKSLQRKKIIVITLDDKKRPHYRFQRLYSQWQVSSKQMTVTKNDYRLSSKQRDTKEKLQKKPPCSPPKKKKPKAKKFVPPTCEQVMEYFAKNGFPRSLGERAFKYYDAGDWKDGNGKKVQNWKQKCISVWMKDEHRKKPRSIPVDI